MKAYISTVVHIVELLVTIGIVYLIGNVLGVSFVENNALVSTVVLNALAKFARSSGTVKDYVNK